ncbi:MAG: VCBS repeat-containing protein [Acidobacteria bacterium]|nr:VCBS repeat-containing protein [Acidobacteriota bacterium]
MAFLIVSGILSISAASGDVDPGFNASAYATDVPNAVVNVIKKQPDGKILIGGTFTDVNGTAAGGIARLNADLTVDTSFNPPDFGNGFGFGGAVFTIGLQSDGKIIVAGNIDGTNNVFSPGIKRLLPNGALDTGFQAPAAAQGSNMYDIEMLPNDKFLLMGLRYNADGSLDNSFTGLISGGNQMELQPDGKILAGSAVLRRYNADGTVDSSFPVVSTDGTISDIVYLSDGKILIGGSFVNVNGFQKRNLARINADGSLDLTFNQNLLGPNFVVTRILVKGDGKILIGGAFTAYNGTARQHYAQLNADGSLDTGFPNPTTLNTADGVNDIEALPSGKFLLGITPNATNSAPPALLRYNDDGTLDNTLNLVVSRGGFVSRTLQQPDGKVLIAGQFRYVDGVSIRSVARLNPDGTLDTSFVPDFTNYSGLPFVQAIALQPDGKILVGGGNTITFRRLNADGSLDTSFTPPANAAFTGNTDIVVQSDGKILASGDLKLNSANIRILRLNSNGSLDSSFNPTVPNGTVNRMAVQPDGRILIGGLFDQVGTTGRGRIARLNADGSLDTSFNPPGGANNNVLNIALQPDGKVILSGDFTGVNGSLSQNHVGRLNADGSLDTSFVQSASINSSVSALKLQPDGKILIGGGFNLIGGTTRLGLARFTASGVVDATFSPSINLPLTQLGVVRDIQLQTDNKILVGGDFTKINNISRVRVARLLNNTAPPRRFFDYDGDGKADVSVFRPSENKWYILRSSDFGVTQTVFAIANDIPVPADYDGDGKTDVAIFRPSSGAWWYLSSINNAQINVNFGQAGDIPRPSDFDGDGKTDFIVFRPSNSVWYRFSATGQTSIIAFGAAGDQPVTGDFDGDGKSDPAIYRPSTGDWWYASSITGQFLAVHWGQTGDIPAPADYDGDGKTDFAIFRPSDGGWFVSKSAGGGFISTSFGTAGDKPIPADYDGDGKADIAVFRPSSGVWYLLQTTSGFGALQWGIATDTPTENVFVP